MAGRVWVLVMAAAAWLVAAQEGQPCTGDGGVAGVCGPIRGCAPLVNILQAVREGTAPEGSLSTLRRVICAFRNSEPLVCCPTSRAALPTPAPASPQPPALPSPPAPPPRPATSTPAGVPEQCGTVGFRNRIVDGEDAPLRAWPWIVVLRGTVGSRTKWFCGGTLISDRYVLSAAHCFKEQVGLKLEFARIGEHTLSVNPDCGEGRCRPAPQDIPVAEIIRHPEYGKPCRECNDIALLRLAQPAVLHRGWVTPACLPINPEQDMGFSVRSFQGKSASAAGWGSTSRDFRVERTPDVLQQVRLPIRELQYCQLLRGGYPDPAMALCAGGDGRDTCRGDSGGPLTLTDQFEQKTYIVGVTSLGPRSCGTRDTQGLYTSVHHYMPWILDQIRR